MVFSFLPLNMSCASLEVQTWLPSVSLVLPVSLEEPQSEAQEGFLGFLTGAVAAEHWPIQRVLCGLWGVCGSLSWVILDKMGCLGFLCPRTTSPSPEHFILPVSARLYQCCNSFAEQVFRNPKKTPQNILNLSLSLPLHPTPNPGGKSGQSISKGCSPICPSAGINLGIAAASVYCCDSFLCNISGSSSVRASSTILALGILISLLYVLQARQ